MNFGSIHVADIANGPGCRISLFVSGCTHHCKGCFNRPTWDFEWGELYTWDTEQYILSALTEDCIDGLTLLGGEPMEPTNQAGIISLLRGTKALGKTIWLYSGYTFEELTDEGNARCHGPYTAEILSLADVLVDGRFIEAEKDISLSYRGSRNQRVIYLEDGKPTRIITGNECLPEWQGR